MRAAGALCARHQRLDARRLWAGQYAWHEPRNPFEDPDARMVAGNRKRPEAPGQIVRATATYRRAHTLVSILPNLFPTPKSQTA